MTATTPKLTQEEMKKIGAPEYLYCTKHMIYHHRDLFYDNPRGRAGKSSKCKQGQKSIAKRCKYQRDRYTSPETLARREVQNAIKRNEIVKPTRCAHYGRIDPRTGESLLCDGQRLEAHHTGTPQIPNPYDPRNWKVIIWLCNTHHKIEEGKV
jgi:hypothetical protein